MKTTILLAAFCAGLLCGPAFAAEASAPPDTEADWIRRPRPEDLMGVWPKEALKKGMGGEAVIACVATIQGSLIDCQVLEESPKGSNFGRAAIALTPQLVMKPATQGGKPVPSTVRIPVKFPRFTPIPQMSTMTVLSNVQWIEAPTYAQVSAAYPERARARRVAGRATLICTFKTEGRIGGCRAMQEEPRGQGFGRAAKALGPNFRGPATFTDESSTRGAQVQIPVVFGLDMLGAETPVIGKPKWAALPDLAALESIYPDAATAKGVHVGRVRLQCGIVAEGRVDGCRAFGEDPEGLGFGDAALKLVPTFRMSVWTPEGLPTVGGQVTIPIKFQTSAADADRTGEPSQ